MVQAHILYSGVVQGVGFRFATRQFAEELGLNGWVRNLADGRVEVLAQGPEEKVLALTEQLDENFRKHIISKQINFSDPEEILSGFSVYSTR